LAALSDATVWGNTPSSSNFVLPSSVVNNGGGDMASANFKLLRALLGLTGTAVTQGVTVGGRTWSASRTDLNTYCGGNVSP